MSNFRCRKCGGEISIAVDIVAWDYDIDVAEDGRLDVLSVSKASIDRVLELVCVKCGATDEETGWDVEHDGYEGFFLEPVEAPCPDGVADGSVD